mgnify:CR=1 FL=1
MVKLRLMVDILSFLKINLFYKDVNKLYNIKWTVI